MATIAARMLLTAVSGVLYALAFPPASVRGLAWIALVPLLLALRATPLGSRLGLGALWTLVSGWGVGTWMPGAVSAYFDQPTYVGVALFLLVTGIMAAPYYMAFAAAYGPLARRYGAVAPLLAGAAWAGAELARGRLLNGIPIYVGNSPWATFGYSQAGIGGMVQIASVTGVYGLSFTLVCVNAALTELLVDWRETRSISRRAWLGLTLATGVVVGVLGFGALALRSGPRLPTDAHPISVAIVQANLGAASRWEEGGAVRTLDAYRRLTLEAFESGRPEIVFWPEAALTFFLEQQDLYRRSIGALLGRRDAELVVGAPRAEGPEGSAPYTNSVYLVAPDGTLRARYDKEYLLPFMEYFPVRLDLLRRRFGRIREFSPGQPTAPLRTRAGAAGILVCNEALLPHVATERMAEGAGYLVNPSNDSWVSNAGFAEQQFDIVSLRAVEQRTFLIRASDSGPSAVVDPFGRVLARSRPLERKVLLSEIVPTLGRSIYGRVGDLFGSLCLLATLLALLAIRWWTPPVQRDPRNPLGERDATR